MFTGLADMVHSVEAMIHRAVVAFVGNGTKVQTVRVDGEDAEHWQPLGLRAVPREGAEALVAHLGGDPELPAVVAVVDRRDTPPTLAEGEVAVYAGGGQAVVVKRATIELGEGATSEVARVGDSVEVTVPIGGLGFYVVSGSVLVPSPTGSPIPAVETTLTGTITSGSAIVRAK